MLVYLFLYAATLTNNAFGFTNQTNIWFVMAATKCKNCSTAVDEPVACPSCGEAVYCSDNCLEADVTKGHAEECEAFRSLVDEEQMNPTVAAFALGFFSFDEFTRKQQEFEAQLWDRLRETEVPGVSVSNSLVPFADGQWLMQNVSFVNDKWIRESVTCVRFTQVDEKHADWLERPPSGKPTQQALQRAKELIPRFVGDIVKKEKVPVVSCMVGQGLMSLSSDESASATLKAALKEESGIEIFFLGDMVHAMNEATHDALGVTLGL